MCGTKNKDDLFIVAKGGAVIFVGTLIENVFRLPLGILLARFLGPEYLGLYHLAVSMLLVLASLALIGFGVGFVRFVPVYRVNEDKEGLSGFIRIGIGLPLTIALLASFGLYVGAPTIAGIVYQEKELLPVMKTAALILPVWVLVSLGESYLRGNQKMYHYTLANKICTPLVRCLLVVFLAISGYLTLNSAFYAFGASLACSLVLVLVFIWRQLALDLSGTAKRYDVEEIFKFSLPVFAANLLLLVGPNIKLLLLGFLGSAKDVGMFGPVSEIASLAALLFVAVSRSAAPRIASLHARGLTAPIVDFYQVSSRWVFTVSLPLFLVIMLFAEPILLIFGSEFVAGAEALRLMGLAGLFTVTMGITQLFITMAGKPVVKLFNTVVLYLVMFGLDWLLIPEYGLSGAAVSTLAAAILVGGIYLLQIKYLHGIQPFSRVYFKPVSAGALASAIAGTLNLWIAPNPTAGTLLFGLIVLFLVMYVFFLVTLGVTEEDRDFMVTWLSGLRSQLRR